jgi:hypothetical protein
MELRGLSGASVTLCDFIIGDRLRIGDYIPERFARLAQIPACDRAPATT